MRKPKLTPEERQLLRTLIADLDRTGRLALARAAIQHGSTSVFAHCVKVACFSLFLANKLHIPVNTHALLRGARLHDYFLYDWHDWDNGEHQWHGFTHGHAALVNALKDFKLNDIERNSIENHMFPMTPVPPRYIEGYLVTLADKCSATAETFSFDRFNKRALPAAKPYAEIEARR